MANVLDPPDDSWPENSSTSRSDHSRDTFEDLDALIEAAMQHEEELRRERAEAENSQQADEEAANEAEAYDKSKMVPK